MTSFAYWHVPYTILGMDDDFLGRASVQTSVVEELGEIKEMKAELEGVSSGKVLMTLSWLTVSKEKSSLITQDDGTEGLAKCLLHVYVDSCNELRSPSTSKTSSKPSAIVELQVGNGMYRVVTWELM